MSKAVSPSSAQPNSLAQFIINFVIPLIVLTRLSDESHLGPLVGMLVALAFPVVLELYNIFKHRKISLISAIAIGGIVVTGVISLLGLSEGWLAVRRSVPYALVALALVVSIQIKRSLLTLLLPKIIDLEKVKAAAERNHTRDQLDYSLATSGYIVSAVLILISLGSYLLTRIVITSATGTVGFNQDYAQLKLLSIPFTMLPLIVGIGGAMVYLFSRIEKLTGLGADSLLQK